MKRLILCFLGFMCVSLLQAKQPVVEKAGDTASSIEVVNDSTIIYHNVYGIQVAQPQDVYTGIFKLNASSKKPMKLMIMSSGAYIWKSPNGEYGSYILYASKAFDRVILRARE